MLMHTILLTNPKHDLKPKPNPCRQCLTLSLPLGNSKGNPNLTNPNTRYRCEYCIILRKVFRMGTVRAVPIRKICLILHTLVTQHEPLECFFGRMVSSLPKVFVFHHS